MATDLRQLGDALKQERVARGFTQAELARKIEADRKTIVDLEAGRNVGLVTFMAALAALGKGVVIASAEIDLENVRELFPDED